jgi:hypothetical protein
MLGMMEYTLVFRRAVEGTARARASRRPWVVVRPALLGAGEPVSLDGEPGIPSDLAQVFVVPICSALGLDGVAYEHFLSESGVLEAARAVLGTSRLKRWGAAITARKEVQALVMAAEVQHIIDRMSA